MKYVWLIICHTRSPDYQDRGSFQSIIFNSEKEAIKFCKHHDSDYVFYTWQKIMVGKF